MGAEEAVAAGRIVVEESEGCTAPLPPCFIFHIFHNNRIFFILSTVQKSILRDESFVRQESSLLSRLEFRSYQETKHQLHNAFKSSTLKYNTLSSQGQHN